MRRLVEFVAIRQDAAERRQALRAERCEVGSQGSVLVNHSDWRVVVSDRTALDDATIRFRSSDTHPRSQRHRRSHPQSSFCLIAMPGPGINRDTA
jgi:hypothetical protein